MGDGQVDGKMEADKGSEMRLVPCLQFLEVRSLDSTQSRSQKMVFSSAGGAWYDMPSCPVLC